MANDILRVVTNPATLTIPATCTNDQAIQSAILDVTGYEDASLDVTMTGAAGSTGNVNLRIAASAQGTSGNFTDGAGGGSGSLTIPTNGLAAPVVSVPMQGAAAVKYTVASAASVLGDFGAISAIVLEVENRSSGDLSSISVKQSLMKRQIQ